MHIPGGVEGIIEFDSIFYELMHKSGLNKNSLTGNLHNAIYKKCFKEVCVFGANAPSILLKIIG
jgi:hypothetical protein